MTQPDALEQFDLFRALQEPFSSVKAIHNVLLVDAQPGDGFVRLFVEHNGTRHELRGVGRWSDEWSRKDVGRYGYLEPRTTYQFDNIPSSIGDPTSEPPRSEGVFFRAYAEQSLRRVPELDDGKGNIGWTWRLSPKRGFLTPGHIVPGKDCKWVPDETVPVTVRVPPEFLRECRRVQLSAVELLEGFIGDAAGIQNYADCPRADGFGSNGSDERDMAEAWIQRAYGMNAVDLDELDAQKEEAEQREMEREDFGGLLDEFVDHGGQADELFKAVQALVDQQREKNIG